MNSPITVMTDGFVELVDIMGSDYKVLQSARVSTKGTGKTTDVRDRGLIRYLYKNKHTSPFEQVALTFHIKVPIFVARQWMRHRTQSYNELSQRYSEAPLEFYTPGEWRSQGDGPNHQGSGGTHDKSSEIDEAYSRDIMAVTNTYQEMISSGVAREHARMILPVSQFTEIYLTLNLRNLFHFLHLRLHHHAQQEIRVCAEAALKIIMQLDEIKWSVEIFHEMNELEYIFQELVGESKDLSVLADKLREI